MVPTVPKPSGIQVTETESTEEEEEEATNPNMWVWATSPLPLPSPWPSCSTCLPCSITTSTKSPRRLFSRAVSAQSRQSPRTQNDHPKASLMGQAVLNAFESNGKQSPHNSTGQHRPLRGSDVLWALRRASAEKSKKRKKDVSSTSRPPKLGNGQDKTAADYSQVRPLTIKTDWSVGLEQLEKRLQQLMDA